MRWQTDPGAANHQCACIRDTWRPSPEDLHADPLVGGLASRVDPPPRKMALPPRVVRVVIEEVTDETHGAGLRNDPGEGLRRWARSAKSFVLDVGDSARHAWGRTCDSRAPIRASRTPRRGQDKRQHQNDR